MNYEDAIKKVNAYCDSHATMTFEEVVDWLAKKEAERPTQIDLGRDIKYSND
jgi:exoribonuclease II